MFFLMNFIIHFYLCGLPAPRFWPAEVRHRINVTYGYFASGLAVTAAAAYGAMRVESVMRFLVNRPFMVSYGLRGLYLLILLFIL